MASFIVGDLIAWSWRYTDRFEPQVIEALQGIKVIEIACGAFHSAIITEFKDLYTFGWDNYGQLGLSIEQKLDPGYPNCIEFPVETSIQSVACGEGHTIVALDDNTVWSCGWNKYGQLGHSLDSTQSKWQLINLPINKTFTIDRCICGPWNTFIVVNTDQDKL
ncbi:regulator of chromosome condensation 1/beta-lactamase-inhibitor protein II [Syncephalis fuscata]|nr:regulator of chromosome condensation 1/beta-lactamase-inhibitor protein II [Syncephalis fuscata]